MNRIGSKQIHYEQTTSTNELLKELVQEKQLEDGTVLTADFQSAGKGQSGTAWESRKAENLLASYLVMPASVKHQETYLLSMIAALSVHDACKKLLPNKPILIKWPNDILCEKQKIAGILIENSLTTEKITQSIIGIGINVNQTQFSPDAGNATSLSLCKGEVISIELVLETLSSMLNSWYNRLLEGQINEISEAYHQNLYGIGVKLDFTEVKTNKTFSGMISCVDKYGRLILKSENKYKAWQNKEIRFMS